MKKDKQVVSTPADKSKTSKEAKSNKTLTGQPADQVVINPKQDSRIDETTTLQQRLRRGVVMKRNAKKMQQARHIARKRVARSKQLRRRALKRARQLVRQRIAGQRGKDYGALSTSSKIAVDRLADKRKKQIVKIANRIAPRIKRDEIKRLASVSSGKRVSNTPLPIISSYEPTMNTTLTEKAAVALKRKAARAGISFNEMVGVFVEGIKSYPQESNLTPQQWAFAKVNSMVAVKELDERKHVKYTARDMTNTDLEHLPKVLSFAQHSQNIKTIGSDDAQNADRKKAEMVRRATGEMNRKIIESVAVQTTINKAATRMVRGTSPQMNNLRQSIVRALKNKKYDELANIILYLARKDLNKQGRIQQEDVCVSEEDYIYEEWTEEQWNTLVEENNEGRKLNKPFRTPGGPKKFAVYVKNEKGNIIKLGFGDPNLEIKRDDPDRRKAYRARHGCDNPGPKWKANYWSCNWSWSASKKVGA